MSIRKWWLGLLLVVPLVTHVTVGQHDGEQTVKVGEAVASAAGLMVNESALALAEVNNEYEQGAESGPEDTEAFKQAILLEPGLHEVGQCSSQKLARPGRDVS